MRLLYLLLLSSSLYTLSAITVEGDAAYKTQVRKALTLLQQKAPQEYQLISSNIGIISQYSKSGMRAWENPPRYQMSNTTAFYSLSWCAGTIAHDAYHSYLYHINKPATKRTPYEKWAGFRAERSAIDFQLIVMQKIRAPKHEIDYLKTQDGTHGDTNRDGKLDKSDYEKRDW